INRYQHAYAHVELLRVQVENEKLVQSQYAILDPLQNLLWRVPLGLITQMKRIPRFVRHDADVALVDGIAAEVHIELDLLLQHHHELSGVVVSAEEFFAIVQSIDVLPSATDERFKKRRPADVIENGFPVERVTEIAERFVIRVRRELV